MDSIIKPLEETKENPGGGSTDVGDVSWNVANINLGVTTAPKDTPWHSWAMVACGGVSIWSQRNDICFKSYGYEMLDFFENPELVKRVKAEYVKRKGDEVYKAIILDVPPPINKN